MLSFKLRVETYRAGERAARAGANLSDCPHAVESHLAKLWRLGWHDGDLENEDERRAQQKNADWPFRESPDY